MSDDIAPTNAGTPTAARTDDDPAPRWEAATDLVVVGSGVAGLTAAIEAKRWGLRVLVVTKASMSEGNTRLAQGGVAVVLPEQRRSGDTVRAHIQDTLVAGAGLCDEAAVTAIVTDGPTAIAGLRRMGAIFDTAESGALAMTREGGHSAFRVIRAGGDATGAEVERTLVGAAREHSVAVLENHVVVDVVRAPAGAVGGVLVLDGNGTPGLVRAPAVLLASGGIGQLYQATSNPEVATADGVALALRAGAVVTDLEFVQFHPTVLYVGRTARGRCPLVTEAVRGEGAVLIDATGARIMTGVHPLADLAPRDVVSAVITRHMAGTPGGVDDHVFLDATHLSGDAFRARFPTVYASCRAVGVDPSVDPIPVVPAAHFGCGGVASSVDGRTSVTGLYAAGEVARTGLHGANRLASNSLLEGLVVGTRVARAVARDMALGQLAAVRSADEVRLPAEAMADRSVLQRAMSRHAAIGRDDDGLAQALALVTASAVVRPVRTGTHVEDAALTLVARALLTAAAARQESRGCHVRIDHVERDDVRWGHSLQVRLDASGSPMVWRPAALAGVA